MAQTRSLILDHVGSTNREALALADAGVTGPLWLLARRQTAGRGRADRQWVSAPGNLHASLLLQVQALPGAMPQLSLLAGIATIDAIRAATGGGPQGLRLKWPNDVLVGHAKCAGILVETAGRYGGHAHAPPGPTAAVIGIGIDLAWHPTGMHRAATDLAAHGCCVQPENMLGSLDGAMRHWLAIWNGGRGFPTVRQAWLERAGPVGEMCAVDTGRERIVGAFADLDAGGALVLGDSDGRRRIVTFGDVALVAAAAPAAPQEVS